MLVLRDYQQRSLDALESYFKRVVELAGKDGADLAFYEETRRQYKPLSKLPGLPYVCLRVPTGGGKTLMACYAVGIAAKNYLLADRATVLWLAPTNIIKEQTLSALRNREHPYRQTLETCFSNISVMDLSEALSVQRETIAGDTCIIVSTFASQRVKDIEDRKVYETAGALQSHFSGLDERQLSTLEKNEHGVIAFSLANVLRLARPVVIIDEAHNARTDLSFETLARLNPSCIIEFTATPETTHDPAHQKYASNVLHQVSAAELKAEQMVKLPIRLRTRPEWKEVVWDAVVKQSDLEEIARSEERQTGEYIRPIVLYQAQPKQKDKQTIDVDEVKKCLVNDCKVPEERIAVATGEERGIKGIDLFDRNCPIRHIITVKALNEGWDCSFAYVLCSVQETHVVRSVEQVLGRILRMPKARNKKNDALNCAYAFTSSANFKDSAESITDALLDNGFERIEAKDLVIQATGPLPGFGATLDKHEARVDATPDMNRVPEPLKKTIIYNPDRKTFAVWGPLSAVVKETIKECFGNSDTGNSVIEKLEEAGTPYEPQQTVREVERIFKAPGLSIRVGGELELFEQEHFLHDFWSLNDCSIDIGGFDRKVTDMREGDIDVKTDGKLTFVEKAQEDIKKNLFAELNWTLESLVNWIDRNTPHSDITQTEATVFLHRTLTKLIDSGWSLSELAANKYRIQSVLAKQIDAYRKKKAKEGYNRTLFGTGGAEIVTSYECCFEITENNYAPSSFYSGRYQFAKHFFSKVGELKDEGEEFDCACYLDRMKEVDYWLRNIPKRSTSFWLQTCTDKFYPDFVARLKDSRILVVEYKGEHLIGSKDSDEKEALGKLWADRSNGQCLFVMVGINDLDAIQWAVNAVHDV